MKRRLLFSLLSGTLLLAGNAHGQYKFVRRSDTQPTGKKTFHYLSKENSTKENRAASGQTVKFPGSKTRSPQRNSSEGGSAPSNPPVINDPIDIYTENPALVKATLTVHFGAFNKSPGVVGFSLYCDPYYDYHTSSYYIVVANLQTSNIHADTVYQISLYDRSDNQRVVTYQDFVTKWGDAAHPDLARAYWANRKGGSVDIQPTGTDGTISRLSLVLQFETGTKTIQWNTPRTFSNDALLQFDQNLSAK